MLPSRDAAVALGFVTAKCEQIMSKTKLCHSCGAELAETATVCATCKEYQSRWRNEFKYWGSIVGLITLITSGATFSTSFVYSFYKYRWPNPISIGDLNTFESISVINQSDQNVWVTSLKIYSPVPEYNLRWDINQIIKPRELHVANLPKLSDQQFRGLVQVELGSPQGAYATNIPETERLKILAHNPTNYVPVFLYADGAEYLQAIGFFGKRLTEFKCSAELTYTYIESQTVRSASIPCIGVMKERIR